MSLKAFGLLAPLALDWMWAGGMIGSAYWRDVDRTPAQVMSALEDLDIREQPGSPGTDPAAAGGVAPLFRTERTESSISSIVMSGDREAARMTALLEPLDGGARIRVTAKVVRGDAPDDFVSPAFRSTGITLGLFRMTLEDELNELVAPPRRAEAEYRELEERLLLASAAGEMGDRPDDLGQAVGSTARTVMRLHAIEGELRRNGCPTGGGGDFESVSNQMGAGGGGGGSSPGPRPEVNFEPGQPMVDVSR